MLHYFFKLEAIIKTVTRIPVNFDLRSLQIFAVAAERGGMTQCARALDMTQSGVSQTIAKLEEIVGSDLFDRTKRPIGLTLAGRALLLRAHKILDDVQNAYVETAQSGQSRKIGTLTIAMPDGIFLLSTCKSHHHKHDEYRSNPPHCCKKTARQL